MSDSISALGVSIGPANPSSRSVAMVAARRETAGASAGSGSAAARGAADWLCLAATPTFALMALLTGVLGGGAPDLLCAAATASPSGLLCVITRRTDRDRAPTRQQ